MKAVWKIAALTGVFGWAGSAIAQEVVLPVNTLVEVTPAEEITSKEMKEGTTREFLVARDVVEQGVVVIQRGAPVTAEVTWRTGKGIVGKSAKFELGFRTARVAGHDWRLRGMHRQEGRGNTAGALLGSMIITGKSATMIPGQIVNVFTAEPIPVGSAPAVARPTQERAAPPQSSPAPAAAPDRSQLAPGVRCTTCR